MLARALYKFQTSCGPIFEIEFLKRDGIEDEAIDFLDGYVFIRNLFCKKMLVL